MNKYMKTSLVMFIFGSKFTVCNENNMKLMIPKIINKDQ